MATINAILNEDFDAGEDAVDVMDIRASDTVGMVGYFYPVVQRIKDNVKKLYIFERHITDEGLLPDWCENIYLDYKNQALVLHILKKLSQRGITIIMTSHFPNHVWNLGDKVAMMGYGGFVAMGNVEEVMTEENLSRTYGIDVQYLWRSSKTVKLSVFAPGNWFIVCDRALIMKKRIGLIDSLLVAVMLFMCACSGAQDTDTAATGNEKGQNSNSRSNIKSLMHLQMISPKATGSVCQNAELTMEDVTISDVKATAASVQELVDKYFNNKVAGDVNVVGTDGYQVTMSAKDFWRRKSALMRKG